MSAAASRSGAVLHLHGQHARTFRERAQRRGLEQMSGIERHEEVADPLDLAQQVAGQDDRDAELRAGPAHQLQHLVAPGRIEAVGRLVQQQQPRIVHQGLGQLDALLHARGVGADGSVALLVEAHVAQHLRGAFPSRCAWQAGHLAEVADEVRGGQVGRQAVVFRHVANDPSDIGTLRAHIEVHDPRLPGRRLQQPQQDLDERALAGAVGADEADDGRFEVQGQAIQGDHVAVSAGECGQRDEWHGHLGYPGSGAPTGSRAVTCGRVALASPTRRVEP